MSTLHKKKATTSMFAENSNTANGEPTPPMAKTTIQAGPSGATLLRIDVPKLRVLLKADKELEECMRTLAFQSLQSKLQAAQSSIASSTT